MPASFDWLIVGLGNPGEEYAHTRHNIGWHVCNALIAEYAPQANYTRGEGKWLECAINLAGKRALVVLPLTYMNLSGKAVAQIQQMHKIPAERIIAIVDEYNFPVGKIHVKNSGSGGGHNGTASLIQELKSEAFWRLRCGIDKKFPPGGMADYVLADFTEEQLPAKKLMIEKSLKALALIAKQGAERAVSAINSARFGEPPLQTAKKEHSSEGNSANQSADETTNQPSAQ